MPLELHIPQINNKQSKHGPQHRPTNQNGTQTSSPGHTLLLIQVFNRAFVNTNKPTFNDSFHPLLRVDHQAATNSPEG